MQYRCFVIDTEHEIPPELIVSGKEKSMISPNLVFIWTIVHVLQTTPDEFQKMEEKQKLPKPKLTKEVKQAILDILQKRLTRYSTELKVVQARNFWFVFNHDCIIGRWECAW